MLPFTGMTSQLPGANDLLLLKQAFTMDTDAPSPSAMLLLKPLSVDLQNASFTVSLFHTDIAFSQENNLIANVMWHLAYALRIYLSCHVPHHPEIVGLT